MKGVGDVLIDNGNRGSDSYLLFTATLSNAIFKIALSYSNLMNASPSILNSNTFTIKDKKEYTSFNCHTSYNYFIFISFNIFPECF